MQGHGSFAIGLFVKWYVFVLTFFFVFSHDAVPKESIRDFFEPGGSSRVSAILNYYLSKLESDVSKKETALLVLQTTLRLCRTANKSENNKGRAFSSLLLLSSWRITYLLPSHAVLLMRSGVGELVSQIIQNLSRIEPLAAPGVLQEACLLLRGLCLHDDLRRDMSCAYENGRFFLKQPGLVGNLMHLSGMFPTFPAVASAALAAARNLVSSEEAVQVMSQHGALELVKAVLLAGEATERVLLRSAIALMRNLCADDLRKDRLVADGTLDLLIHAMGREDCQADAILMEHSLACLAAMALRSANNAQRIIDSGVAVDRLVLAMRKHFAHQALQRQGCLAIRNIAARSPDVRSLLLDAGAEEVLRVLVYLCFGCGYLL